MTAAERADYIYCAIGLYVRSDVDGTASSTSKQILLNASQCRKHKHQTSAGVAIRLHLLPYPPHQFVCHKLFIAVGGYQVPVLPWKEHAQCVETYTYQITSTSVLQIRAGSDGDAPSAEKKNTSPAVLTSPHHTTPAYTHVDRHIARVSPTSAGLPATVVLGHKGQHSQLQKH